MKRIVLAKLALKGAKKKYTLPEDVTKAIDEAIKILESINETTDSEDSETKTITESELSAYAAKWRR